MIDILYVLYKKLEKVLCDPISEAQREYRKNHLLNKYSPDDWRDDIFWRN